MTSKRRVTLAQPDEMLEELTSGIGRPRVTPPRGREPAGDAPQPTAVEEAVSDEPPARSDFMPAADPTGTSIEAVAPGPASKNVTVPAVEPQRSGVTEQRRSSARGSATPGSSGIIDASLPMPTPRQAAEMRIPFGTKMRPELIARLKAFAFAKDAEIQVVLDQAVDEYLSRRGG